MPLVDLANPGQGTLAKTIAGPFSGFLPNFNSRFDTGKYFKEHSYPTTIQKGGDGVTNLDDPTYLGFDLMFMLDSPLFSPDKTGAVSYLEQVDVTRADYLKAFINGIRRVNSERPWYWQTITGLDELWNKNIVDPKDPYVGTQSGEGISIGCLEAIDMKITALFALYRLACYDTKYRRIILPQNLRYFDCRIRVLEIRNFKSTQSIAADAVVSAQKAIGMTPAESAQNTLAYLNDNTSCVTFILDKCQWDPKSGAKVFDSVTNTGGEYASTSIKFSYGNISEEGSYSGLDTSLKGNFTPVKKPGSFVDQIGEKAKTFAKEQLANAANEQAGKLEDQALGAISHLNPNGLGNVYGLTNRVFQNLNNPEALINSLNGAGVQTAQVLGQGAPVTLSVTDVGGNIFPPNTPVVGDPGGSLESTKAFPEKRPRNSSLPSEGIFQESPAPGTLPGNENALGEAKPGPGPLKPKNLFDG